MEEQFLDRLEDIHGLSDALMAIFAFALFIFSIWMVIDCLKHQREYYWLWIIFASGGLGSLIYYYQFLWEGSSLNDLVWHSFVERRKIKDLLSRLHFVDNAGLRQELAESYLRLGKLEEAEKNFHAALDWEPDSFGVKVSLGYCLLAQERADEAWPYLRAAYKERPDYDDDELLWQCARCQTLRKEYDEARALYEYFLSRHSYYATRLEYAHLLLKMDRRTEAGEMLSEISDDLRNSPRYIQRREGRWGRQARRMLRDLTTGKI